MSKPKCDCLDACGDDPGIERGDRLACPTWHDRAQKAERAAERAQLKKFYGCETDHDLIASQAHHIERLQAKLPKRDLIAFQKVRA